MGIKCINCKEEFHANEELVFDGDEEKLVNEANPDWSWARCVSCHEEVNEAAAEALSHSDPTAVMQELGYVFTTKHAIWIKAAGI